MTDDIVARLRVWSDWLNERCPDTEVRNDLREAADEIERLRAERDAARAEVCLLRTGPTCATENATQSLVDYAKSRGWTDLFNEENDER